MDEKSRILIVDDIEENLKVLTETLTQQGFYPLQAKSGERAIQIAKKAKPDLILMDIKMPGLTGYETIDIMKADEDIADIPVIFISALNQIEDKVKGFKAGAVDYVSKPFQKEEVIARVTTHLKLRNALRAVEVERKKSDELLYNILPTSVANELKETGRSEPQRFSDVSVLFSDVVNFVDHSEKHDPVSLIGELNEMFTAFDDIMEKHGCERIKTIGDAYMAVCGVPVSSDDHAKKLTLAALDMKRYLNEKNADSTNPWEVRIGIHSGEMVGGIVGVQKYIYDVFGDTVNIASRMESASEPMGINISEHTYEKIKNDFNCTLREKVEVKSLGLINMYFVDGEKT